MRLIAIGRLRAGAEAELFQRYNTRLRPELAVTELPEAHGNPPEIKRRESAALLAALPRQAYIVALDQGGAMLDSQAFSASLQRWVTSGRRLCLLVGGAEGLDASVIARADFVLSFGAMTWPHFLVRAMLAEQLYRAQSIVAGHPYHRDGRPSG